MPEVCHWPSGCTRVAPAVADTAASGVRRRAAANALWPRTAIDTAAMMEFKSHLDIGRLRSPEIMADAAYLILTSDAKIVTGNFFVDDEVLAAAQAAGLGRLLERLPQGVHTQVGETGVGLSLGERQRLQIARILVDRPRILVLDEPTAALDVETEREIVDSLATTLRGRTAIIITHRPSLASIAGQIITLDGGKISEEAFAASQ